MKKFRPESRRNDIVVQDLDQELLVYDLLTHKALCINKPTGLIWQKCNGQRSVSEITNELRKEYDPNITEEYVLLAIDLLNEDKLLVEESDSTTFFAGMSRRDLIKKVGLGSAIAIPLITSITSPKAINAQSNICMPPAAVLGCTCAGNNDCQGAGGCCAPNFTCITFNSIANGQPCRANCNCVSGNCDVGGTDTCVP